MNYFQIFGIPVQLQVDKNILPKKYFELSKKFHPDFYTSATPSEQQMALEISSKLNIAFKTFQNSDDTIKYVLKLKNLLADEEKYQLPGDFLAEILEINEQLMDQDSSGFSQVHQVVIKLQQEIFLPVKNIIETYEDGITPDADLLLVKEYYFKNKYLNRIIQNHLHK